LTAKNFDVFPGGPAYDWNQGKGPARDGRGVEAVAVSGVLAHDDPQRLRGGLRITAMSVTVSATRRGETSGGNRGRIKIGVQLLVAHCPGRAACLLGGATEELGSVAGARRASCSGAQRRPRERAGVVGVEVLL
jgi:hypothetical protein